MTTETIQQFNTGKETISIGDLLHLERQTIYYQPQQSFKETFRTIKTMRLLGNGVFVRFKEYPKNEYRLNIKDGEIYGVSDEGKTRYEVLNIKRKG